MREKLLIMIVLIMLWVQVLDLSELFIHQSRIYNRQAEYQSSLKSEFWDYVAEEYNDLVLIPPKGFMFEQDLYYFAALHRMTVSMGRYARPPFDKLEQYANKKLEMLSEGKVRDGSVYIIGHDIYSGSQKLPDLVNKEMMIGMADGYIFIMPPDEKVKSKYKDLLFFNIVQNVDLLNYLSIINSDSLLFIAAKDNASRALNPAIIENLQQFGFEVALINEYNASYYGIGGRPLKENAFEKAGSEILGRLIKKNEQLNGLSSPVDLKIISAGTKAGNIASIKVNGVECSLNNRGLNIVIYDLKRERVSEIAHFDTSRTTWGLRFVIEGDLLPDYFAQYAPGTKIVFSQHGNSYKYTGQGWSVAETQYTWTTGDRAELLLKIDDINKDLKLKTHVSAFIIPGKVDFQRVVLMVNDIVIDQWIIDQLGVNVRETIIPKKYIDDSKVELVFILPDAVAPSEVGGLDERLLGIAVHTILIKE